MSAPSLPANIIGERRKEKENSNVLSSKQRKKTPYTPSPYFTQYSPFRKKRKEKSHRKATNVKRIKEKNK
jgi:hypothetical protein